MLNLTEQEKFVLELYVKAELDKDFDLQNELKKYDINDNITIALINQRLINADIRTGLQGDVLISYNYKKNGHILSDYVLDLYNIKQ